ncbi:hypothetical protein GTY96_21210 [Corallococcus sp. c25j21]|nr:hypothetical protein [Corallococcus silvisoli]
MRRLGFEACLRILARAMVPASSPAAAAPTPAVPGLSAVPAPQPEPSTRWLVGLLLVAALLPRMGVFFLNENLFGDAVVRTELAERWLADPHVITSYKDGTFQFGPLHLYLVGAVLSVFERDVAGRLVSLVFGVLSVVPLFALTRRLFGWRAGVAAGLAFSAWGMHLQFSTTAGSEAVSLFFMLCVFALVAEGVEENRFQPLFWGAVLLNFACALRYDAWMYIPLLTVALVFSSEDRVASLTRAVGFGLVCLPFPLLWMQGNELAHGDPFFPIKAVDAFHQQWVVDSGGAGGPLGWRLQQLGFWPAVALFTLTPGVALLGGWGMVKAWKQHPETRWLVVMAVVPALYFTFRAAVLLSFVPLARFTVTQLVLLPVFLAPGFAAVVGSRGVLARRLVVGVSAVLAMVMPVALGIYTFRTEGGLHDSLRPVSPTSTNPVAVMQVARFLKEEVASRGGAAAIDDDPRYMDLQVAFFSGLPEMRMARVRWDTFRQRMQDARPDVLVRFDQGKLVKDPGVTLEGRTLTLDGVAYQEQDGFSAPLHVYRRQP